LVPHETLGQLRVTILTFLIVPLVGVPATEPVSFAGWQPTENINAPAKQQASIALFIEIPH
jgi:hypothetical protein